jgi:hypothetical protein
MQPSPNLAFAALMCSGAGLGFIQTVNAEEHVDHVGAAPLPGYSGAQLRQARDDVARLDRDASGELDRDEVREVAALAQRFDDYDIDDNGTISLNEYQSWLAAQPRRDS